MYRPVVKTGMNTLLCLRISYLQEYLDCQEDQEDPKGGHEIHLVNICHQMTCVDQDFVKRKQKDILTSLPSLPFSPAAPLGPSGPGGPGGP